MSGPGSGGSNPRKFSEKIALHNQKQAEETRAFEQLMTDLTVSRVQFQKEQHLRLSQPRGQYYGGSLPNVNQMCNTAENQASFPQTLDPRGTRHHGLVERVHRPRISSPHTHRRSADKHRHSDALSPYGQVYLSPPPDHTWRRTNSDSALHTSVTNPPDGFGPNQNQSRALSRAPQRNTSLNEAEDGPADVFSFPSLSEDALMETRPLPKQIWDTKVQSLASRPKSCEVPGINIFPSPDQNMSVAQYQPCLGSGLNSGLNSGLGSGLGSSLNSGLNSALNSGGSLPDLTSLHFPSPLWPSLDSEENYSHQHLPHAMMQMGLSSSLSNPSLCSSPRRRPAPISPLTLSPEQRRGAPPLAQGPPLDPSMPREPPPPYPHYQQSHSTTGQHHQSPLNSPVLQGAPLQSPSSHNHQNHQAQGHQSQHHQIPHQQSQRNHQTQVQNHQAQNLQGQSHQAQVQNHQARNHHALSHQAQNHQAQNHQAQNHQVQSRSHLDFGPAQNMSVFSSDSFMEPQCGPNKSLNFQDNFSFLDRVRENCSFDPSSSSSSLFYSPAPQLGLHGNASSFQMNQGSTRPTMLFPQAALPNIVLTDDSGGFSLEDELRIEPLTLDGLSMLSDPELVLPDPGVEESFRSERL